MKVNERVKEKNKDKEREREKKDGREQRAIKDFSDEEEMCEMREWPNSFTDLRSRYLVLNDRMFPTMCATP